MKAIITFLLVLLSQGVFAQSISGRVVDEHRQEFAGGIIELYANGHKIASQYTDSNGMYTFTALKPGEYNLLVYVSCETSASSIAVCPDSILIKQIPVTAEQSITQNFAFSRRRPGQEGTICRIYKKPPSVITPPLLTSADLQAANLRGICSNPVYVIDPKPQLERSWTEMHPVVQFLNTTMSPTTYVLKREQIQQMPCTSVRDMIAILPGVYQSRRGGDIRIFGSRMDGNAYIIDGMR